jgi:hypothetical protein
MNDPINKKMNNLEELELTSSLLVMQVFIKQWIKLKPNNNDLEKFKQALLEVTFITNKMIVDKRNYYNIIGQYRADKLRAIQRAEKAELKLIEYDNKK